MAGTQPGKAAAVDDQDEDAPVISPREVKYAAQLLVYTDPTW